MKEQAKAFRGDYTGCVVILFDKDGKTIGSTLVKNNNKETLLMQVQSLPDQLSVGSTCRLLILTEPAPCEYQGRIVKDGATNTIAMYHGRMRDDRRNRRIAVTAPAQIEFLVYDGQQYALHTPIKVTLINISRGGMRLSAPNDTLVRGSRFHAKVNIVNTEKSLAAEVVNMLDVDSERTEYGCRFLIAGEKRSGRR